MGKIVALGGGVFMGPKEDQMPPEMEATHKRIIALTGKQHPKALCIPTASNDPPERIRIFQDYYTRLGCSRVEALCLLGKTPPREEIERKIREADLIFVTGGNTHRMIATWKRLGVHTLLRQAYKKGTVMSGYSAGAICWFTYGNSDSFSKDKIFRVTAMGIFDALLCPHYDSEPHRQPALKKMMRRTPGVAIVLDEYAGIEIVDGKYRFLTAKPDAKARRAYWHRDEYVIDEQASRQEWQDLDGLLRKP